MILSSILAIALGGSALILREVKFERTRALYVRAFFAAESGIEKILTSVTLRQKLLFRAMVELNSIESKYNELKELDEVFSAVKKVRRKVKV